MSCGSRTLPRSSTVFVWCGLHTLLARAKTAVVQGIFHSGISRFRVACLLLPRSTSRVASLSSHSKGGAGMPSISHAAKNDWLPFSQSLKAFGRSGALQSISHSGELRRAPAGPSPRL